MLAEKKVAKKPPVRVLSWTAVIYPESLPENWKDILGEMLVPWACSPLHDKDINADGSPKKPHYHLLLAFRTKKSFEQVKEITDKLHAPIPQPCRDTRALVRYFVHKDNPEKAQYKETDITSGGGFDIDTALSLTQSEEDEILFQICDFIGEQWVTEFHILDKYVRLEKREWWRVFRKNTFYLSQIIKSQRHDVAGAPRE